MSDTKTTETVMEVVKKSLKVEDNGDVSFRSRFGKGSGKAVLIPKSEFDAFVKLMLEVQKQKETNTGV